MGGTAGTGSRGWREVFTAKGDSVIKDEVIPKNWRDSWNRFLLFFRGESV